MINLSSSSLFHFTTRDNLIGILKNNFYPRYCMEQLPFSGGFGPVPIAMVSFCDIPLSSIINHTSTYGSFGIGLKKDWAVRNSLNPVFYLRHDSSLADSITNIIKNIPKKSANSEKFNEKIHYMKLEMAYLHFVSHIKMYEGTLMRDNVEIKDVKYYDEKEWRYIPNPLHEDSIFFISINDYQNDQKRAEHNLLLEKHSLLFVANDIEYIIVPSEEEILPIIKDIIDIKGPRYDDDTVTLLKSRVLTVDQIKKDF